MKRILVVLAVVLWMATALPAAELVKNGSFENPVCASNSWCVVTNGTPGLWWTVVWAETVGSSPAGSPGNLEFWNGSVVSPVLPRDGQQNVELDTHGRSGTSNANVQIYQPIETCPGAGYTLAYSWRPRPNVGSASQNVTVKWAGSTLATHTGYNLPWQDQTAPVSGAFGLQNLMFIGGGTGDQLGMLLDAVSLVGPDPAAVNACTTINIKPFSDPNSINVCSSGTVPVTIWGSAAFDVASVDPSSLLLGGAAVNTPGKSGRYQCSISDSGSPDPGAFDGIGSPDGYPDLTCHFTTAAGMFDPEATSATVSMTLCEGGFAEGCAGKPSTSVTASDSVRLVKEGCE